MIPNVQKKQCANVPKEIPMRLLNVSVTQYYSHYNSEIVSIILNIMRIKCNLVLEYLLLINGTKL